jgi:hypothetical protein
VPVAMCRAAGFGQWTPSSGPRSIPRTSCRRSPTPGSRGSRSRQARVRWVPLVQRGPEHPNDAVGLSPSGSWVIGDLPGAAQETLRVHTRPAALSLLPLLEWPYEEAASRLRDGVARAGLDDEVVAAFPWRQMLGVAIESKRDWWLEHAVDWLPHCGPTPDDVVALSSVVRDKHFAQRLRQAVWRLLPHTERRRHAKPTA